MKMKGQMLVFEQVLIFTISVVIFITSFALFVVYQNHYSSETSHDQLIQIREYVMSNIVEIADDMDFESSVTLSIPKRVGNDFYRIRLTNQGLNITSWPPTNATEKFSTLYDLNQTFTFSGTVASDRGKIIIYKKGNSIYIQ